VGVSEGVWVCVCVRVCVVRVCVCVWGTLLTSETATTKSDLTKTIVVFTCISCRTDCVARADDGGE
jgi:hypothetical protein